MMLSSRRTGLVGFLLCVVACSASGARGEFEDKPAGSSGGPDTKDDQPGGGFDTDSDSGASPNQDGCSDDAKLAYVLSYEGDVYSFSPPDKKFTKVGPLKCSDGGGKWQPIAMAVDRSGVAWINMVGEPAGVFDPPPRKLFKFDIETAKCTPSAIGGLIGGMGFSTNEGSSKEETLFVLHRGDGFTEGPSLAKVDFAAKQITKIEDLVDPSIGELTGTGDGRLYGFQLGQKLGLAAVDKKTTALSEKVTLEGVDPPLDPNFAFSFWGGDFYVYTATSQSPSETTTVSRYRPSDKSVDTAYMTQIGFHIVGAGVSTCAPVSSPK